jgi:hypothetical protein
MTLAEVLACADTACRGAARKLNCEHTDDLQQKVRVASWQYWQRNRAVSSPQIKLIAHRAVVTQIRVTCGRSFRPSILGLTVKELELLSGEIRGNNTRLDDIIGRVPGQHGRVLDMMRQGKNRFEIAADLNISERSALRRMRDAVRMARLVVRDTK